MAIPVGPIGILCIRKTLTEGRLRGMVIGLGAATADLFYGSVAAFGLTFISDVLISQKIWIRLVGGALLLLLGTKIFRALPTDPKIQIKNGGILKSYFTTVVLTLTNPLTIFAFIAVFFSLLSHSLSKQIENEEIVFMFFQYTAFHLVLRDNIVDGIVDFAIGKTSNLTSNLTNTERQKNRCYLEKLKRDIQHSRF